ncbi:tRNA-splicing ligase RtcB [Chitinophaga eiseniae]|uniref:3'-phosphate/5'-hydroxy nucleic acid ligase n=1 Tax=Chitinophaga eiseniae TaxID=634771 RepID=A0A1T4LU93_9BACT|nr:RtcB family protein [Chitinophaga eiseniae]SJZ58024.1 tRNA-splicing ligase RtcB [Chitinophaga eiseniae]
MSGLKTKELSKIGYTDDRARSLVINIMARHFKHHDNAAIIQLLTDIKARPADFLQDEVLGKIAAVFADQPEVRHFQSFDLLEAGGQLKVYGGKDIEHAARRQMEVAMSLPVTVQGALMPDAHMGYGLPVGGVLATEQAVIPYAVGVDIGCRMALTLFDEGESFLKRYSYQLQMAIREYTHFGMEGGLEFRQEHAVLDRPEFRDTPLLKSLHGKAVRQLGSSGSGNHFVEFGLLTLEADNSLSLPSKQYLALLSHSGSRGLGAAIAQHYTKIATDTCKLPRAAQQLAWLDMNSEAGQEYWLSMNLAGDYARACHQQIHRHLAKATGLKSLATIENHHNFAWEETLTDTRKVIIHRKGATPAHAGELGIIPGSMTTPAYLVRGKGAEQSLYSAAHGAGRAMSRSKAREKMTVSALNKIVAGAGVTLIGGSVEENPLAYKDIDRVMDAQRELVQVEGRFMPAIVRMHKE